MTFAEISGIYQIQSKIKPEKIYIGSAVNLRMRRNLHLSRLRRNIHDNKKLQFHFNKYGESDFQFFVLLGCERKELIDKEQFFIDSYNPWFNNRKIANSNLGMVVSEKTRLKMSKSGLKRFAERPHSIRTRVKMSLSTLKKSTISNKTRIKMSDCQKVEITQYDKNNNFIKHWDSIKEAQEGLSIHNISCVLRNIRKTAGKFKWKYKLIL